MSRYLRILLFAFAAVSNPGMVGAQVHWVKIPRPPALGLNKIQTFGYKDIACSGWNTATTTDAGLTWVIGVPSIETSDGSFMGILLPSWHVQGFASISRGFIFSYYTSIGQRSKKLNTIGALSIDHGRSWSEVPTDVACFSFARLSDSILYRSTTSAWIFYNPTPPVALEVSRDAGRTWRTIYTEISQQPTIGNIGLIDSSHILIAAGMLRYTSNAGVNWDTIPYRESDYVILHTLRFLAGFKSGIWLAGTDSGLFKSLDNGHTWEKAAVQCGFVNELSIVDSNVGFMAAQNGIYSTYDDGATWIQESSEHALSVSAIAGAAYALGDSAIYRRVDPAYSVGSHAEVHQSNFFPNPASSVLHYLAAFEGKHYDIYDETGLDVTSGTTVGGSIDIQKLPSGDYWIRIGNTLSGFVIER